MKKSIRPGRTLGTPEWEPAEFNTGEQGQLADRPPDPSPLKVTKSARATEEVARKTIAGAMTVATKFQA